jgi:hypothetical protein
MTLRPPAHLEPFVTALGEDDAIRFFLSFGGAELYIPADPKGNSELAREMGIDVARRLSALAQERYVPRVIPIGKPWIAQVWRRKGLPIAQIARKLHASQRAVTRWLADASDDARPARPNPQMSLF